MGPRQGKMGWGLGSCQDGRVCSRLRTGDSCEGTEVDGAWKVLFPFAQIRTGGLRHRGKPWEGRLKAAG